MTSTILTAALGLLFWVLAARLYTEEQVGIDYTVIFTMTMTADLSCVGLRTGIAKFLPAAGTARRRILMASYAMPLVIAATAALFFVIALGPLVPDLVGLRSSFALGSLFVLSTAVWSVFILQDSALMALRHGPWVPAENTVFGIVKILLLLAFVSTTSDYGIFLAWALPVIPIVIAVNLFISRRLRSPISELSASETPTSLQPSTRNILTFSFADWLSSLARVAALLFIPYLVLLRLGDEQAGYYAIAWTIAFTTYSLSNNVADALLAESSYDQGSLNQNARRAMVLTGLVTGPVVLVGVVGAPFILSVFGETYAENATTLLRTLLPAAIPNIVVQIYIGRMRSKGRMNAVILTEAVLAVFVVGLALVLVDTRGLDGIGLAWLISISLIAVGVTIRQLLANRGSQDHTPDLPLAEVKP